MNNKKEAIDADVATPAEIESLLNALEQATGQSYTDAQKRTPMWAEATTIQTNGHWDGKTAQPDALKMAREALERIEVATRNEVRAGDKGYVSRYGINGIARAALEQSK